MYLNQFQEKDGYTFLKSNTINDNFWNFATQMTYQDFQKDGFLKNVEETFTQEDRIPCIYIPTSMKDSDLIQEYLFTNGYQIKAHDVLIGSYAAIVDGSIVIVAIIIGIYRFDIKKVPN
jgi:hypothetical protein